VTCRAKVHAKAIAK